VGVRLSSIRSPRRSASEGSSGAVRPDPHSTSLAVTGLVSPITGAVSGPPPGTSSTSQAAQTAGPEHLPRACGTAAPSRLEVVQSSMRAQGFSEEVAQRIASSHRTSTQRVYNSRWNVFCTWCEAHGHDPLTTTAPLVADFLTHLHYKGEGYFNSC
jgi:hypothetical protein